MASVWSKSHVLLYFSRRGDVSLTLSFQTRRELLQQMVPRYRGASAAQKGALLDEIAATTGYVRRYAMWLLNHSEEGQHPPGPRRQPATDQRSKTPSSWPGKRPIGSVASGSCRFCQPSSMLWRGMGTCS